MNAPVLISASFPQGQAPALPYLSGALSACGAWIVRRAPFLGNPDLLVFEFPRDLCAEVYSALVCFGLELNRRSHRVLTDLCCCTPDLFHPPSQDIRVLDAASLDRATEYICSLEIVQAELSIRLDGGGSPSVSGKTTFLC